MANQSKPESSAEEQAKYQPQPSVQPVEPEDPAQAGDHQSDQREALQHNVQGKQAERHPEYVPAQHATGSFTDKDKDHQD